MLDHILATRIYSVETDVSKFFFWYYREGRITPVFRIDSGLLTRGSIRLQKPGRPNGQFQSVRLTIFSCIGQGRVKEWLTNGQNQIWLFQTCLIFILWKTNITNYGKTAFLVGKSNWFSIPSGPSGMMIPNDSVRLDVTRCLGPGHDFGGAAGAVSECNFAFVQIGKCLGQDGTTKHELTVSYLITSMYKYWLYNYLMLYIYMDYIIYCIYIIQKYLHYI